MIKTFTLLLSNDIIYLQGNPTPSKPGRRWEGMDDMPNATEIAVKLAEENTTRKILSMVEKSKDLDEVKEKLETMLEK